MAKSFQKDTAGTLTTNLISWYKMGDVYDFYGTNHGTASNVTFGSSYGKYNNGGSFVRSSSSNIACGDINMGSGYSISAWINPATLPSNNEYYFAYSDTRNEVGIGLWNDAGTQKVIGYHTNSAVNADLGPKYTSTLSTGLLS